MDRFGVESTNTHKFPCEYEEFGEYADAVQYACDTADSWEANGSEPGDRSWASRDNLYCIHYDDGRYIAVVKSEQCGACLKPFEECRCDKWCPECGCMTNHTGHPEIQERGALKLNHGINQEKSWEELK